MSVEIENTPISVQLNGVGETESVTVPSNEVWKVTIQIAGTDSHLEINDVKVTRIAADAKGDQASYSFDTVLVGGDTVKADESQVQIGGFVINTNYNSS